MPARHRSRGGWANASMFAVLVAAAVTMRLWPLHGRVVVGPFGAALLLWVARWAGLDTAALGLARASWRRGAVWAAVCVVAVAAGYAVLLLVPGIRTAFLDERYRTGVATAVLTATVVIPLGTVLLEEVAFRGVLWALVRRRHGPTCATAVSSILFGLWHVVPSLRLNRVNPAVAGLVGSGRVGQALAVAGAVLFTALAGALLCELRRRSGSLLAPAALHWAVNGLGVVISAGLAA